MTRSFRLLGSFSLLAAICACGGHDGLSSDDEPGPVPPHVAQTPEPIGVALAPTQEPPLQLQVEHAGGIAYGPMGAPITLGTGEDAPTVTVRPEPHRTFPHGNLRFSYPAAFVFEAEIGDDLDEWSLSGNHFEIMIFRYPGASDAAATVRTYVEGIRGQFGSGVSEAPTTVQLGERSLSGTRLNLRIATQVLTQDAAAWTHRGSTYLLVLQDGQPEHRYPEATEARQLLATTFELR